MFFFFFLILTQVLENLYLFHIILGISMNYEYVLLSKQFSPGSLPYDIISISIFIDYFLFFEVYCQEKKKSNSNQSNARFMPRYFLLL